MFKYVMDYFSILHVGKYRELSDFWLNFIIILWLQGLGAL